MFLASPVLLAALLTCAATAPFSDGGPARSTDRRGRAFACFADFGAFERSVDPGGDITLTSPTVPTGIPANEAIVSWNADTPPGAGIIIRCRTLRSGEWTAWYVMGRWSQDGVAWPRVSVDGQRDADGEVRTDTLALVEPAEGVQVQVSLHAASGQAPELRFLAISLADTRHDAPDLDPDRAAWGREITVPGLSQLGWPGGSGWCSPTSTAMVLDFWSLRLSRPELDVTVPQTAAATYDAIYKGTGNWPFNAAFAGSFAGMRAYVARLSDIRELEEWVLAGIPPVVSVSYDLLRGKPKDQDPGHLMVCDGFTADGDIVLNDPAHHPERGEVARRVFPRADFLRAWRRSHYLVYLIYPIGAAVPGDRCGHWESAGTLQPREAASGTQ